jgi:hypothetical protein
MAFKLIRRLPGFLLLMGVAYFMYPLVTGAGRMQSFCGAIQAGEPEESLLARVAAVGYDSRKPDNARLLLIDSRAMGRFICDVSILDGKTAGATYVNND